MSLFGQQDLRKQRQLHLLKLQKQMQGLKNEMEFVEILAQFWPLPNMAAKMERLESKLQHLDRQVRHYSDLKAG
jgi:hypothetical protein